MRKSTKQTRIANGRIRCYTSILADECHAPVSLQYFQKSKWAFATMGFFCNGICIGSGELGAKSKISLHTDNTRLIKGFRNKGHGIELYMALIDHARRLGATRIYSSSNLNKHSRRMWRDKLSKLYDVKKVNDCKCKCKRCMKEEQYYICLK